MVFGRHGLCPPTCTWCWSVTSCTVRVAVVEKVLLAAAAVVVLVVAVVLVKSALLLSAAAVVALRGGRGAGGVPIMSWCMVVVEGGNARKI